MPHTGNDTISSDDFAEVAFSGDYNDLINTPSSNTPGNGTLTIQRNGSTVATFTANQSGNTTANISDTNTWGKINPSNVLSNQSWSGDKYTTKSFSYTATQDCWAMITGYEMQANNIKINNVSMFINSSTMGSHNAYGPFFVKSGQTIYTQSIVQCSLKVFGSIA